MWSCPFKYGQDLCLLLTENLVKIIGCLWLYAHDYVIMSHTIVVSILLESQSFFLLPFILAGFEEANDHGRGCHTAMNMDGQPLRAEGSFWLTGSKQNKTHTHKNKNRTEALSPITSRNWILPITWVSLEVDLSPFEPRGDCSPS